MKKLKGLLLAILAISAATGAFAGQSKNGGTDSLSTIEPRVSNFNQLKIAGPVDIHIVQGTTESLKIMAPTEVIDRVLAEVDGGVLKIRNKHDNWGQSEKSWYGDKSVWQKRRYRITAYVTVVTLKSISISGSGTAKFADGIKSGHFSLRVRGSGNMDGKIDTRSLVTTISGSGHVKLLGTADNSRLKVSGSGVFEAPQLITASSNVHVSGSGDAKINANDSITAGISGSGSVNYTGMAKSINSTKSGSGSITRF